MLIRFSVENFLSYKERQVFSMAAGRQSRHKDHIVELNGKRILKGSFFFGANAAGKSNLIKAVLFAKQIVRHGTQRIDFTNKYFRIDESSINQPGVFQFDIWANGHFYSYGFAVSYLTQKIEEEWLYLCDNQEISIFDRTSSESKITTEYHFTDQKQQQKFDLYGEDVSDYKTFLAEIAERKTADHPDFAAYKDVREWFSKLIVVLPDSHSISRSTNVEALSAFMNGFDTGIDGVVEQPIDLEEAMNQIPEKIRTNVAEMIRQRCEVGGILAFPINGKRFEFQKKNGKIEATQLQMNHGNSMDLFDIADESDGTQRLFDLVPLYRRGMQNYVIFVDELDRSFHTKLALKYIQQFYSLTSGAQCQLMATVHDANIMDLDLLRQDEIWFIERRIDHSTKIYSLNKFQARFDKKVSKDYLLGRYGAIPCLDQMDDLELEEDEE